MNASKSKSTTSTQQGNISATTSSDKKPTLEYLFKVLVIGDLGTGKTSFIKRYVHHSFSDHYKATIGVDFALKVIEWDANTIVRLQLWDIAGQERFGNMTRVYYKEAVGCIVMYDVDKISTFECCDRWKEDLDEKVSLPNGDKIPCILVGNKKDKDSESETFMTGNVKEFCRSRGYAGWFETSAKDNININEATKFLISCILDKNKEINLGLDSLRDAITLHRMYPTKQKSSCCFE